MINVTGNNFRVLFRVIFTKHSPQFYLICLNRTPYVIADQVADEHKWLRDLVKFDIDRKL